MEQLNATAGYLIAPLAILFGALVLLSWGIALRRRAGKPVRLPQVVERFERRIARSR